jgi:acyl transferase domain-containing protein/acyl carrier protein
MMRNSIDGESPTFAVEAVPKVDIAPGAAREPIAIIGLGCRFPGAKDPEAFWRLMCNGGDAITEVPPERFDINAVYDPRPGIPGKLNTRWGGFLEQVDQFDPYFFGISPREAAAMDPQQRLLLEVAWEALEDAGQVPDKFAGSQTGVFVGMCNSDYNTLLRDPAALDVYFTAGVALSVLAGRLSYVLGLQGPSVALDTACSTSLVAVHLACQSLWSGECTLALAGGVNVILLPEPGIGFSRAGALAPDGRCKFGDARANGFVRSEGAGVVVLKPLSQAVADRDPVYAVIRGSAVNNDGRSGGLLMAPSRAGHEAVLREAYRSAGVSPGQVHYVEAHGTGTSVGDPIELQAFGAVLSLDRPQHHPCMVGSVKTNIGHTEGAAGVAGLIKVALALKHRTIPPSLHFHEPHPNVPWQDLPLVIPQELRPWPVNSGPALAGVSSLGISGTNAHVVLAEAPQATPAHEEAPRPATKAQLLTLSAHSPEALKAMARAYQEFLGAEVEAPPALRDVCYTASVRRTHHDHRLALVGRSRGELVEQLAAFLRDEACPGMASGCKLAGRHQKLVFVFSGQGSQWLGMGQELLEQEPVFRETIERCDQAMREHVHWSVLEELTAHAGQSRFNEVDVIQPAIFAIQVALAALWQSWGIVPAAVVGQSLGEVAAAYVAGALSLADATRIICRRSRLVKSMSGQGGMAVVGLSLEAARRAVVSYEDLVSVAVSSSPSSTVLSGDPATLQEILDQLERQDVFCRWVKVDYASHSPQVEPLRPHLLQALEGLQPRPACLPIYSTVTGAVSDGREFDATYWVRNLREPVLFATVVQRLVEDGHDVFLEVSPHPVVLSAIQDGLRHLGREGAALASLREGEGRAALLGSLGALYTRGHAVDWSRLYPSAGRCVRLPSYSWQRERLWFAGLDTHDDGKHPLLGQSWQSAAHAGTRFWEMDLSTQRFPYLADHRVQGLAVLPATAYVGMALAAAEEVFGSGPHTLEEVAFRKAFFLPEAGTQKVQLVVSPQMPGVASFQFFSLQAGEPQQQAAWTLHATGTIRLAAADPAAAAPEHPSPADIQAQCPEGFSGTDFYQTAQEYGLQYGPGFQGVEQVWRRDGEALGRLSRTETVQAEAGAYHIHPALLDAGFQVFAAALPRQGPHVAGGGIYLPVGLSRLWSSEHPDTGRWSHALLRPGAEAKADTLEGDVLLLDEAGRVVLQALGLRVQRVEQDARHTVSANLDDWLYELQWQPKARPEGRDDAEPALPSQGSWLIFADRGGIGKALAALLEAQGERCVLVSPGEAYTRTSDHLDREYFRVHPARPEDMQQLLETAFGSDQPACRGVVHLWSLDAPPPQETTTASLQAAQTLGCISVLYLVQALAKAGWAASPRLWLVTRGAQAVEAEVESVSIAQAPVWGLGKVISLEHPELRCTKVDLSSADVPEEMHALFQELWSEDHEDQLALRGDTRYVARLVRCSPHVTEKKRRVAPGEQPFRLEIPTPGILDNFILRETTRQKPGPGEVEIAVRAVGLNFRDVMIAMDLLPQTFEGSLNVGWECAGTIAALGENVEGLQVGDAVFAFAPLCFGTYTTTLASLVMRKPTHISFEEAATIPIVFATAYYALHHMGRLGQGERVLIHAAAGGVGQAAVQLAQWRGAEIFATAGSPEKREFLKSQGVQYVMDSRSLDFAEEVMRLTNGEGVDVVLNSLAGEFIPKSLATLRAGGRFLEIGKIDILQNTPLGLGHFEKNISFCAIDLGHMFVEKPQVCRSLFRELLPLFEAGSLRPLPLRVFPISEAASAFRHMAQAKHIGKVVISLQEQEVLVAPSQEPVTFRADGTYLITGGLGGLGLVVAQWMVQQGARHLVLMGRSGTASTAAAAAVESLQQAGAEVMVAPADVAQEQQVARVLTDIRHSMPPLRGIMHAAAVLDDGILLQLNEERFKTVMAPKIHGAWNLHTLTLDTPLDFFVLFSSAASVLGSPGQGNYVAASAFLDALAHHRRALGLPTLAINWGAWAEVGLAARPDRAEHLMQQGIIPFTPAQGVQLMGRLLQDGAVQVTALALDWAKVLSVYVPPLLSQLAKDMPLQTKGGVDSSLRVTLLAADPEQRQPLLESYIQEQVARVLGIPSSRLDPHRPLNTMGLDSLMAVELKNRTEASLGVTLPVTSLLKGPSIVELATELLKQLPTAASKGEVDKVDQLLEKLEQLSEEEVQAVLAKRASLPD